MKTNPGHIIKRLMYENAMTPADMARTLNVQTMVVNGLMEGDSPESQLYGPLAAALGVPVRFVRALYARPCVERETTLAAVLTRRSAA